MMAQWAETWGRIFNIDYPVCCVYWLHKSLYYCKTQREGSYQSSKEAVTDKQTRVLFWFLLFDFFAASIARSYVFIHHNGAVSHRAQSFRREKFNGAFILCRVWLSR